MSIWRHLREEAAGAIRSVRYDLVRRGTEEPPPPGHSRHRFAAVGAGLLVLAGAVGTYFLVVGGLNGLLAGGPDGATPPGTAPSVVTVPGGPATGSWAPPLEPVGAAPPPAPGRNAPAASAPPTSRPTTAPPPVPTPRPTCRCTPPPTPRPTQPTPTPTASPSPSATPTPDPTLDPPVPVPGG